MPLRSTILSGNPRLEQAAHAGGPSVKPGPPHDDVDAVMRIQRALVALGFALPLSFPNGPDADPDGIYGSETRQAVVAFQKRVFPNAFSEWDGRTGTKTLTEMDRLLPSGGGGIVLVQFPVPNARLLLIEQIKKTHCCEGQCRARHIRVLRLSSCIETPCRGGQSELSPPTPPSKRAGSPSSSGTGSTTFPWPSGDQPRFGGEQLAVIFHGAGAPEAANVRTFTTTQQKLMTKSEGSGAVSRKRS